MGHATKNIFLDYFFLVFIPTEQMLIYLSKHENTGYTHALWKLKKESKIS